MNDTTIIAAIITSVATGIIGIWQIVLTRKSLENGNRPYVTIYNEVLNIENAIEYIVIKNSGNMPAQIKDIIYDEAKVQLMNAQVKNPKTKEIITIHGNNIINNFKNSTLAPNQSYRIPINNTNTKFEELKFTIIYQGTNNKTYTDKMILNLKQNIEMTFLKSNNETAIGDTLQEMLKRM